MTRVIRAILVALATLPLLAERAFAHHGAGLFDMRKNVELEGKLTRVDFVNPHTYVYFDVVGVDGKVIAMKCETRGATVLRRSGWSPEMFVKGATIKVTGRPHRDDPTACTVDTLTIGGAPTLERYQQLSDSKAVNRTKRPLRLPNSPATGHRSNRSWQRRQAGAPGSCRSARPPRSGPANCRCRMDPPAGSRRP
jgi:hypothetical protein